VIVWLVEHVEVRVVRDDERAPVARDVAASGVFALPPPGGALASEEAEVCIGQHQGKADQRERG
jgi:hypothetical protein